jgi:hypothetical protein
LICTRTNLILQFKTNQHYTKKKNKILVDRSKGLITGLFRALSQAKKALKNLVWYFKADEFSPHPLLVQIFAFGKTLKRVFRSFTSSNLGKNSENTFRNFFSKQKILQKTCSEVFLVQNWKSRG